MYVFIIGKQGVTWVRGEISSNYMFFLWSFVKHTLDRCFQSTYAGPLFFFFFFVGQALRPFPLHVYSRANLFSCDFSRRCQRKCTHQKYNFVRLSVHTSASTFECVLGLQIPGSVKLLSQRTLTDECFYPKHTDNTAGLINL